MWPKTWKDNSLSLACGWEQMQPGLIMWSNLLYGLVHLLIRVCYRKYEATSSVGSDFWSWETRLFAASLIIALLRGCIIQ